MRSILLIVLAGCLVIYAGYRKYCSVMLSDDLDKALERGAIILDVRTAGEYAKGHIEGSVNISLGTIRERFGELDVDKIYVTTCSHGLRSVKAENLLKENGFKHVYNGGAWTDLHKIVNPHTYGR